MSRVGLHILSIIGIINIKYTGYAIRFKDKFPFKIKIFRYFVSWSAAYSMHNQIPFKTFFPAFR